MKHRYLVIATGLLAFTAVIALWAASLQSSSPDRTLSPAAIQTLGQTLGLSPSAIETLVRITPPPISTPPPRIVTTADEALRVAAPSFIGSSGGGTGVRGLELAQPASVSYVETTVGQARNMFLPPGRRPAPEVPDDALAWVFVAVGRFQPYNYAMGAFPGEEGTSRPLIDEVRTPTTARTAWFVVPKDGAGGGRVFGGYADQQYDLNQLGAPVAVPSSRLQDLCDEMVEPSRQAEFC